MKWTPSDVIRLCTNIGGIIIFLWGLYLLGEGISADGTINITTIFASGEISSGSAGLFVIFLAAFLIIASNFCLTRVPEDAKKKEKFSTEFTGSLIAFIVILCAIFICIGGFAWSNDEIRSAFAALGSLLGFIELFLGLQLVFSTSSSSLLDNNEEYYAHIRKMKELEIREKEAEQRSDDNG